MDTAYESLILPDPLVEQRMSVWQRLRRALTLPGAGRERLIELQRGRVVAMAVALQVVALGVLAAVLWLGQRTAAEVSAVAAVAFVDGRLDELDATLRQVQGRLPRATSERWACTEGLTQELLRTSLDSMLAQRIWLVAADGVQACGPQGAGSLGELPPIAGPALALVSLRSIAIELVLARRLSDGRLLAAKLDPRAMALPAHRPAED